MVGDGNAARRVARDLAKEFGTTVKTMEAFLHRFGPRWTQEGRFASDADLMFFVHIPKTAGMSLGESLAAAFTKFRSVAWPHVERNFRLQVRQALYLQTQKPMRQVVMGHFGWKELQTLHQQDLPLKCGALLRDPLARLVSNFNYNRSEAHPGHGAFRKRFADVESYARQQPFDLQMTQAIGWVDSFDRALARFTMHYSFLGVTERMTASLAHLARTHGLTGLEERRVNVALIPPTESISEELIEIVERRFHNDAKLHRLLMRLYDEV
ncbi:sulfotransferase family 2 domain-containing protein [Fuscovulum ytuae]|uniref:Sulfotransferase family 2 domain-containing protein n=1 Tax=Fuscovulum ytuae TaxID=3042299 RepID=A0ABY8Q2N5_9RHOB|nr:sulfotransferase family 2 domain-containing protein [Fuscovulum sp. YMD61]WGV14605.1 sulfotransferase family 2 domain-containing protein [Fuscovulum sp. YMD61]